MTEIINNIVILTQPINTRKSGSGRQKGSYNKQNKYVLEFDDKIYICKTISEMAVICGRSRMCLSRILLGHTTFKKKTSEDLKKIKMYKINGYCE